MKTGRNYKFWFCTGSQDLYGDECLRKVAEHSRIIVEELNKSGIFPFELVWKDVYKRQLTDTLNGKIACDVECNPLHGPRAEELIKALEAGEEVEKLNYVDEEIFAADDTVASVTAVNSLEEEGEYAVTPITQEIIDGRAY